MGFPIQRPRRLRRSDSLRALVRETHLLPSQLMLPLFVVDGSGIEHPIADLEGHSHLSPDKAADAAAAAADMGIGSVLLFGVPGAKDPEGRAAARAEGPVQKAVRAVKKRAPQLIVATDVCLCAYTTHGHCGVIDEHRVLNDASLPHIAAAAVSHADAGADIVAPSDMMDGRVGAIRAALDGRGHEEVAILAYSAKYASAFYGPFRSAAGSAPSFGDRKTYQMDPANAREAVREVLLDVDEGADMVMVKPAGPYLDVIRRVRDAVSVPVAAYQVSGEYMMLHDAARAGHLDLRAAALESVTGILRAGADLVITYFAPRLARDWR